MMRLSLGYFHSRGSRVVLGSVVAEWCLYCCLMSRCGVVFVVVNEELTLFDSDVGWLEDVCSHGFVRRRSLSLFT